MADKRISQLIERTDIANNDVLPIVASGATTTNKVTISTIQEWMQDNLDVGVTSVGITVGTSGTDVNVSGSPITTSGNITINIPTASATNRGLLSATDWSTFTNDRVPYTGATGAVNLGTHAFASAQININGNAPTAGSYLGFKHSTNVLSGADGYTSMYTFGTNTIAFKSVSGATTKDFSFSMVGITAGVSGGRQYTLPDASGTLALTSDLSGYVTLGTAQTITATKTFTTSGSGNTINVNHTSGSGHGVEINKAGNGEGLRVIKTSGSGNAVTISGGLLSAEAATLTGALNGTSATLSSNFYVSGGTNTNTGNGVHLFNESNFAQVQLNGATGSLIDFSTSGSDFLGRIIYTNSTNAMQFHTNSGATPALTISSTGAATFSSSVTAAGATFNGLVSVSAFSSSDLISSTQLSLTRSSSQFSGIAFRGVVTSDRAIFNVPNDDSLYIGRHQGGAGAWEKQVTFATNGNVGIGTTPATWSTGTSLEIGSSGNLALHNSNSIGNLIAFNTYYNGDWYRKTTSVSLGYIQDSEGHKFYFNGSGGANTTFSPTERMRITSGGVLMVNNTGSVFHNANTVLAGKLFIPFQSNADIGGTIYTYNDQTFATYEGGIRFQTFKYNGSTFNMEDSMTLNGQGRLGIGTTSPQAKLNVSGIENGTSIRLDHTSSYTMLYSYINGGSPIGFDNLSGTLVTYVGGGEKLRLTSGGFLKASNNGTYLDSAASYHEIRSTSGGSNALVLQHNSANTPYGLNIYYPSASPNSTNFEFIYCNDSTQSKFIVWSNGSVVNRTGSYGAISDAKVKENIEDATPKLDDLMKVKVRNYNLIGDDKKQIGVIAQELEEVFPAMIDESEDFEDVEVPQVDEEGNEVLNEEGEVVTENKRVSKGTTTKSVKYSVFVPMLLKAMQEQQEQIKELRAEIEALKLK